MAGCSRLRSDLKSAISNLLEVVLTVAPSFSDRVAAELLQGSVGQDQRDHGFRPITTIDEGVPRFVTWYREHHSL